MIKMNKERPWELPHEICLLKYQANFLRSCYSDPIPEKSRAEASQVRSAKLELLKSNRLLYKKALQGSASAFLELISRDPRYLCSELGLYFICRWRHALEIYQGFPQTRFALWDFRSLIGRLPSTQSSFFEDLRGHLDFAISNQEKSAASKLRAQENLAKISTSLLKSFDARGSGSRSIPPLSEIKPWYYAAVVLFAGLKRAAKGQQKHLQAQRIEKLTQRISEISDSEIQSDSPYGFLIYVKCAAFMIGASERLSREFDPGHILRSSPSSLAANFGAELFGLGGRTVQKCANSDCRISWQSRGGSRSVIIPPMRLENYPPAVDIFRKK